MTKIQLTDGVYWVGVVDWNLRDFHGYTTPRGGTYNAYLVVGDEKIALVDTVKHGFGVEMIEKIKELVDPSKIDYVVSNHVEMDHSSSLPDIMKIATNAQVIATEKGKEGLLRYYRGNWNFRTVKTGDELALGKKTLFFIAAPMLHWPDSMFTYLKEDKILLSNDGFGQHLATSFRFDEEMCIIGYECDTVMDEAAKYYANILMPFGSIILKKIEEMQKLGIEIKMIAPSHGMIWKNPAKIIDAYLSWAKGASKQKVLVIYDTMWNSTEIMAQEILRGVSDAGVEVSLFHLRRNEWSEILKEVLENRAIIIGSPTLHNGMFPTVGGFLTYLIGLRPKNKLWATFGSYGWAGGAVKAVNEKLKLSGYEPVESLEVNFRPDGQDMAKCYALGQKIASMVKA